MLFKKALVSLGILGAAGGTGVGIYHSVRKNEEKKPNTSENENSNPSSTSNESVNKTAPKVPGTDTANGDSVRSEGNTASISSGVEK